MFSSEITIGFLAWVFALLINRLLAEKALRPLSAGQKAALLDSFSASRTYGTVLVAVLSIVFILAIQAMPLRRLELVSIFLAVIVLSHIMRMVWSYLRLRKLGLPRTYVNNFVLRCVIYFSGLSVFILMIVKQYLKT